MHGGLTSDWMNPCVAVQGSIATLGWIDLLGRRCMCCGEGWASGEETGRGHACEHARCGIGIGAIWKKWREPHLLLLFPTASSCRACPRCVFVALHMYPLNLKTPTHACRAHTPSQGCPSGGHTFLPCCLHRRRPSPPLFHVGLSLIDRDARPLLKPSGEHEQASIHLGSISTATRPTTRITTQAIYP